jgi:hypothetical protein
MMSLQESIAFASGRGKRQSSDAFAGLKVAVNVLFPAGCGGKLASKQY